MVSFDGDERPVLARRIATDGSSQREVVIG
jgi:hypothetical protein